MSHTHTGARFAASKFKIRIRVGSASALNHPAYSRARSRPNLGEVAVRQQTSPPSPFARRFFAFLAIPACALPVAFVKCILFIDKYQWIDWPRLLIHAAIPLAPGNANLPIGAVSSPFAIPLGLS